MLQNGLSKSKSDIMISSPGHPGAGGPDQRARARAPAPGRPGRGVPQGPQEVHEERRGLHEKAQ